MELSETVEYARVTVTSRHIKKITRNTLIALSVLIILFVHELVLLVLTKCTDVRDVRS